MKTIFVILNEGIFGEEIVVAVFDNKEQADSFAGRNATVKGKYSIIEKEINPVFITGKIPYYVMINPPDEQPEISVGTIIEFEEEKDAVREMVRKVDDAFHMYLYAENEEQAEAKAREKFTKMVESGEWLRLTDVVDEVENKHH